MMKHVCISTVFSSPQGNRWPMRQIKVLFLRRPHQKQFWNFVQQPRKQQLHGSRRAKQRKNNRVASQLQKIESITSPMAKKLLGYSWDEAAYAAKVSFNAKIGFSKFVLCRRDGAISERRRDFSGFDTWIPFSGLHAFFERKICKFVGGCLVHKMFWPSLRKFRHNSIAPPNLCLLIHLCTVEEMSYAIYETHSAYRRALIHPTCSSSLLSVLW